MGDSGIDMLRLLQAISLRSGWSAVCTSLTSQLMSKAGSVEERTANDGAEILTFNAADRLQIRRCAAQVRVLAVETGLLSDSHGALRTDMSAISLNSKVSTGLALELGSSDETVVVMDSPWAQDVCNDVAHSFLATRRVSPRSSASTFCQLYASDLQELHPTTSHSGKSQAERELQHFRLRAVQKRRRRFAEAAQPGFGRAARSVAPPMLMVEEGPVPEDGATGIEGPPITQFSMDEEDDSAGTQQVINENEGADFWQGFF